MSTTEDLSQVTELSYQTIESNLIWELKITEASTFSSRKVKLPFINGEW